MSSQGSSRVKPRGTSEASELERIKALHELSYRNHPLLSKSALAGCYYCGDIYPADEIVKWVDKASTALCPHCGIDSVLSDKIEGDLTETLLAKMYDWWFGRAHGMRSQDEIWWVPRHWGPEEVFWGVDKLPKLRGVVYG